MSRAWVAAAIDRAASPGAPYKVDRGRLAAYLAEFPATAEPWVDDLCLAFACIEGTTGALVALETRVLQPLRRSLGKTYGDAVAQDTLQQLRIQLCVAGKQEAALHQYRARAPLASWVRVIAVRLANKHVAARPGHSARAPPDVDVGSGPEAVELALLKKTHAREVRAAFIAAIEQLEQRDRLLLKLSIVEGLSLDRIAAALHKPRTSVHRWLAQARTTLAQAALARLAERLRLSPSESKSLIRQLRQDLDLSVGSLLVG